MSSLLTPMLFGDNVCFVLRTNFRKTQIEVYELGNAVNLDTG